MANVTVDELKVNLHYEVSEQPRLADVVDLVVEQRLKDLNKQTPFEGTALMLALAEQKCPAGGSAEIEKHIEGVGLVRVKITKG